MEFYGPEVGLKLVASEAPSEEEKFLALKKKAALATAVLAALAAEEAAEKKAAPYGAAPFYGNAKGYGWH